MKENKPIKFIEGKFSPADAKEVLLTLINHKISYHSLKNFSSEERFGKPVPGSQKRIQQLKKSREKIVHLIQQAVEHKLNLRIESSINIVFEK